MESLTMSISHERLQNNYTQGKGWILVSLNEKNSRSLYTFSIKLKTTKMKIIVHLGNFFFLFPKLYEKRIKEKLSTQDHNYSGLERGRKGNNQNHIGGKSYCLKVLYTRRFKNVCQSIKTSRNQIKDSHVLCLEPKINPVLGAQVPTKKRSILALRSITFSTY